MLRIDCDKCTACGVCESSCAFGAISVPDNCAVVNDNCTLCGACVENCPEGALSIEVAEKRQQDDLHAYTGIMVFAECRHGVIAPVTYELLGIGRKLANQRKVPLSVAILGDNIEQYSDSLIAGGADTVLLVQHAGLAQFREDIFAKILARIISEQKPEVVLAGATAIGRSVIPYVATLVVLTVTSQRSPGPAAAGQPYDKGSR